MSKKLIKLKKKILFFNKSTLEATKLHIKRAMGDSRDQAL